VAGLDHDLVTIDSNLFVHIGLVCIRLTGYGLRDRSAHGYREVFEALLDAVDGIAKLEVGVTLLQFTDLLSDGCDALLQLGVVVMLCRNLKVHQKRNYRLHHSED